MATVEGLTEAEGSLSKKLVNFSGRLTHRRLIVLFSLLCIFLVCCMGLLNSYGIARADTQKISLNWMQRGRAGQASTASQPHRTHLKDSLRNVYIKHQYEGWLQDSASNQSFDLRQNSRFMREQASIQRERKRMLQRVCRKHPELSDVEFTTTNTRQLFTADKNRILYCLVPKAGCTNWKKVLMVLEGQWNYVWNITGYEAHKRSELRNLSYLAQEEREDILQNYVKFMYVRHPFVRLISAYRNKIARDIAHQGKVFREYARSIVRKYRRGADLGALERRGSYNVSWDEWIAYLTDPSELSGFNQHWKEVYKMCFPCRIHYDFIGHLESVSTDSAYMLSVVGHDNLSYPSPVANSSSDYYDQYFANVSRANLVRLWKIYALDFMFFGIPKPEILTGAPSSGDYPSESSYT